MENRNEPEKKPQSESVLIDLLARIIAAFVRLGRWLKDRVRRLFGKRRGRYAPLVDMPSAASALSPRKVNPAARAVGEPEKPAATAEPLLAPELAPPNEVPSPTRAEPNLAKTLPPKKAVEFQAQDGGEEKDHDMIARVQARRGSSPAARRMRAWAWIGGRKVARVHRRFPLWMVASFYLLLAGSLSLFVTWPFISAPQVASKGSVTAPREEDPKKLLTDIAQLISDKQYGEAKKKLEKLRSLWPNDFRVYQVEGALLAGQKDYAGARKCFEKALEIEPQAKSILFNLAEVDFVSGNYAAAEEGYRKLTEVWPKNAMILFRLYLCARLLKQDQQAAEILENPGLRPESVEWLYAQGAKNIFDNKKSVGMQYVEKARLLYPEEGKVCELTMERLKLIK